ncbi:MAG: hypothetical protein WCA12_04990, partial [Burkholderiales bacterium]
VLTTSSPTAKGAARRWTSVDDFVREVADSRIYAGIHYRTSTETGAAMGRSIGELASRLIPSPDLARRTLRSYTPTGAPAAHGTARRAPAPATDRSTTANPLGHLIGQGDAEPVPARRR